MKCEEKAIEVRGWRSPPIWRNPFVIAAAAAFLLVVGGLAVVALRSPATPPDSVQLEGDAQFGPAPFTGPVGLDQPGMQLPPWAGGTHFGNASALYAAESDRPSCDAKSLILQLTANPTKAAAWVEPMGLSTRDLGPFVNSLTPVYLRADTAVTDYAYSKNSSHGYPSILQEGTAVLVNSYGEPTVKCFSGDPLGPSTGSIDSKNYSGDPWDTFQADKVCRILPAPSEVQSYVLVDSNSGDHVTTPAKPDPKPVKGPNPEPAGGATTPG